MARSRGRRRRNRRRPARLPAVVAALAALGVAAAAATANLLLRPDAAAVAAPEPGGSTRPGAVAQPLAGGVRPDAVPPRNVRGQSEGETAFKPSRYTDERARAYFAERWGNDKAARRVTDIRMAGGYLRIYTDLPESADDDRRAITLCERGARYLTEELGEGSPVVFVHSEFGENGNPVLANLLGPGDPDCRVTHPAPGR